MSEKKVMVTCCRCEKVQSVAVGVPVGFPDWETLPTLSEMEAALIREALRRANGSKLRAAVAMGMGKTTLYRKLKTLDGQRVTA